MSLTRSKHRKGDRRADRDGDTVAVDRRGVPDESGRGGKLLDDATRERLGAAADSPGLGGKIASLRLQRDALKRRQLLGETSGGAGSGKDWRHSPKQGPRGYSGPFGGSDRIVGSMVEARGTTDVVKGLYPWVVGSGSPLIGTPVGVHLSTGEPVHLDLTGWMRRGGLITAPTALILALNGYGKSSLVRRLQAGSIAQGHLSMVLGDCKPDFRVQTEAMGGQVIQVGDSHGKINPLDVGAMGDAVAMMVEAADFLASCMDVSRTDCTDAVFTTLGDKLGREWEASSAWQRREFIKQLRTAARSMRLEIRKRQSMTVASLVQLVRGTPIAEFEETMISSGIDVLYEEGGFADDEPPLLEDLYNVICAPTDTLIEDAGIQPGRKADPVTHQLSSESEYLDDIKPLRRSLRSLIRGEFGEVFNGPTDVKLDLSAPCIDVDVSNIPHSEASPLRAAVLFACWSDGLGAVSAANRLSDFGLRERRISQVIMDELWQVLQASPQMVSKINQLSRLNRQTATELIMITHSIADFSAVETDAAVAEADGLVERSRVKIIGAVPSKEIERLRRVIEITDTEEGMLTTWSSPPAIVGEGARPGEEPPTPPGTGNFLIKVGERGAGIPFHMFPTMAEKLADVHNTNRAYDDSSILPPPPVTVV
jgi:hypothetical protein